MKSEEIKQFLTKRQFTFYFLSIGLYIFIYQAVAFAALIFVGGDNFFDALATVAIVEIATIRAEKARKRLLSESSGDK